jgi:hypothetical protein
VVSRLHRLPGVFLTAIGAEETEIEASFCEAISTAKAAEVGFASETRGSNLRRIPPPKRDSVTASWLTPKGKCSKSKQN